MSALLLADAKADLGIESGTEDAKLQRIINAAEAAVATRCGPLASTATTSTKVVGNGCTQLVLPVSPVISLTSVTGNMGDTITVGDLTVTASGVVEYTAGGYFSSPWYTVVYQAGRASVPEDLMLAIRKLVRHLWMDQRGPARPGGVPYDGAANTLTGAGYLLPFSVQELIAPYLLAGFA